MSPNVFNEFAILLALAVTLGALGIKLRQPLILSFIIVGVVMGPDGFGWLTGQHEIEMLASFGVTILLFIVGLKLDLHEVKLFGSVALIVGLLQVGLTVLVGWMLGILLGLNSAQAFFLAVVFAFSSTIIIIKMISDRYEIDSLYGRLSVGILVVQDLVVVVVIMVLSSLGMSQSYQGDIPTALLMLVTKGFGFLLVVALMMRYFLPLVLRLLSESRELLILFSIFWAVLFAAATESLGFGKEIGGFIAGMSLASTHYREVIASRLETLRNLLLLFFFLNLGASLHLAGLLGQYLLVLGFSVFVLLGKPLIVFVLLCFKRFRARPAFLTGLMMGQVSELSLIVGALGVQQGYIDHDIQGLLVLVTVVTIGVSAYMITYATYLYEWLSVALTSFERKYTRFDGVNSQADSAVDVVIYGYGRHGENIAKVLGQSGMSVLCVDFDPAHIHRESSHVGVRICYGDAEDVDFTKTLPLNHVKWVVSTIPHMAANRALVASLREIGYAGKIALSAYHAHEYTDMAKLEVDMIIVPYKDAALTAAEALMARMQ